MTQREYLVAYGYGMGGLWAVMLAPSAEAITAVYPDLDIAEAAGLDGRRPVRPLEG
jgi:hypothetical protein